MLSPVVVEAYYPQPQPPPVLQPPPPSYTTVPDIIVPIGTVTPNAAGVASVTFNGLDFGANPIVALYAGDATHYPETTTLVQNVTFVPNLPPSFTSSLNPAGFGQPVTFSVVLFGPTATSGAPSGSVIFSDGGTTLATVPLAHYLSTANIATYTTSMLSAGSHTIKAAYVPTGNNTAATLSLTQVVVAGPSATTTSMTLCIGPSTYCPASGGGVSAPNTTPLAENYGQTFNESTQVVSGDGTTHSPEPSASSTSTPAKTTTLCTISVTPGNYCPPGFNTTYFPGANVITAVYSGDATHLASSSPPITINMIPDATLVTLTSSGDPPLVPTCLSPNPPPTQPLSAAAIHVLLRPTDHVHCHCPEAGVMPFPPASSSFSMRSTKPCL